MVEQSAGVRNAGLVKIGLLVLLGLLWAVRLVAIKAAGLSGIPVSVLVCVSAVGIALFFSALAPWRTGWPPVDRGLMVFYCLTGLLGFLAPFALESLVAPHLPVFLLVVIITLMPIITLLLMIIFGQQRVHLRPILAVGLGFAGALTILFETAWTGLSGDVNPWWVAVAFIIPTLYAFNTIFVASRWPSRVGAVQVAHAQALIVACAALVGSIVAGTLGEWRLVSLNLPAVATVIAGEALALLVYLRVTRDFGATYVSFANYIAMVFAAALGALLFGDAITVLAVLAALAIAASVRLHQSGQGERV